MPTPTIEKIGEDAVRITTQMPDKVEVMDLEMLQGRLNMWTTKKALAENGIAQTQAAIDAAKAVAK